MADSESDRIAKMLHALSSGEHTEDESHKQEPHDDNIFGTPPQEAQPAPVAPAPALPRPVVAKPATPAHKPVVVPKVAVARPATAAAPKPATQAPRHTPAAPEPVQAGSSVSPRPVAPVVPKARPLATPRPGTPAPVPPQPVARPAPARPAPVPPPEPVAQEAEPEEVLYAEPVTDQSTEAAEEQPIVNDDAETGEEAYDADDQMEMPAVPTSVLAHRPRKPIYKRKHMVQTLGFKQAMIPISFTLFVVCTVYVLIGFAVGVNSPFAALRSPIIAAAFGLVGLAMLATCIVTVGQVKHELAAKPSEQQQPGQTA